jgi:broad specificity phosphatase PhoE
VVKHVLIGLAWLLAAGTAEASVPVPPDTVVVYLVRHAEKLDDSRDPPLSGAGQARATELARLLQDAGVTHVWSTDFQRTRTTGQPTAESRGLTVQVYDANDLKGFAAKLAATPGRHLVVGHSNTTPALVRALGGNPGNLMGDAEYDRFYAVMLGASGPVTLQLRWGAGSR